MTTPHIPVASEPARAELASSLLTELRSLIDEPASRADEVAPQPAWPRWLISLASAESRATDSDEPEADAAGAVRLPAAVSIGRFEADAILGSGGFGIVLRAYDPELGRHVALKLLRPDVGASPQARERFVREGRAAAQLEHPGIAAVYDAGEHDGLRYLAAPLCEGPNLATWLCNHPGGVKPAHAAALLADVAEAVQHAHQRGILHRDLKPSNILLKPLPAAGDCFPFQPLLTDFGLAGRFDANGDETAANLILGTTPYMSPEQAEGRSRDIGVCSDIFSLGVVLYELLTGERPFGGADAFETRAAICSTSPLQPPGRRSTIPRDLEIICLKCLKKKAEERYATAGELAADLRRFLRHEPIAARPPSAGRLLWLACRRSPLAAALAGCLALTVLISAAIAGALYQRQRAARSRAEERLEFAREAASDLYTKVAEEWLAEQPRAQGVRREFLADALRFYEQIAAQQPDDERSRHELSVALHRMANIAYQLGELERTVALRQRCLSLVDELSRDERANEKYRYDAFMNRLLLAGECEAAGKAAKTLPALREAEVIIRGLVHDSPGNPVYRDALAALSNQLARHARLQGRTAEATERWHEAAALAGQLVEEHSERPLYVKHLAEARAELARTALEAGKRGQASEEFAVAKQALDDVQQGWPQARWLDELILGTEFRYADALVAADDAKTAAPLLDDCIAAISRLIESYPQTPGHRQTRVQILLRYVDACLALARIDDARRSVKLAQQDAAEYRRLAPADADGLRFVALVNEKAAAVELFAEQP